MNLIFHVDKAKRAMFSIHSLLHITTICYAPYLGSTLRSKQRRLTFQKNVIEVTGQRCWHKFRVLISIFLYSFLCRNKPKGKTLWNIVEVKNMLGLQGRLLLQLYDTQRVTDAKETSGGKQKLHFSFHKSVSVVHMKCHRTMNQPVIYNVYAVRTTYAKSSSILYTAPQSMFFHKILNSS